ncbi:MAG: hypothetical protein AAGG68_22140 [Bacteroidota bacterium]
MAKLSEWVGVKSGILLEIVNGWLKWSICPLIWAVGSTGGDFPASSSDKNGYSIPEY